MKGLGILKTDLEEKFIKSSGKGGQKVNKSASAVFIRHVPTGISVKCGKHRSLHLNRFIALRRLVEQIETRQLGKGSESATRQLAGLEKLRKQKSRRKRRHRKKLSLKKEESGHGKESV